MFFIFNGIDSTSFKVVKGEPITFVHGLNKSQIYNVVCTQGAVYVYLKKDKDAQRLPALTEGVGEVIEVDDDDLIVEWQAGGNGEKFTARGTYEKKPD